MAAISSSNLSLAKGNHPSSFYPEQPVFKGLRLNHEQREYLKHAIPDKLDIILKKPFAQSHDFKTTLQLSELLYHFNSLLSHMPHVYLEEIDLIGSSALPEKQEVTDRDIDLFWCVRNVNGLHEALQVELLFLEALRLSLKIESYELERGSRRFAYVHVPTGRDLIVLSEGEPHLFKISRNWVLDGLRCDENSLFVRLPTFLNKKKKTIEITIGFPKQSEDPAFGFTSMDSIYCKQILNSQQKFQPVGVFANGYDVERAWDLYKKGFFEVNEERAERSVNGLRGYARMPTKGYCPVCYKSETIYFKRWQLEYKTLPTFFEQLENYIDCHYPNDIAATFAYLCNLHTIFSSQNFSEKEPFLLEFDRNSSELLKRLIAPSSSHPEYDTKEEQVFCDMSFLRTLGFCHYYVDAKRLDCLEGEFPSRYLFPFRSGYMLMIPPLKEIALLRTKSPTELQTQLILAAPLIESLGLPISGEAAFNSISKAAHSLHLYSKASSRENIDKVLPAVMASGSLSAIQTLIDPAWLENGRNSERCWKMLQQITGRDIAIIPSLSPETRGDLLKLLFGFEHNRGHLQEILEVARNHLPERRVAILNDLGAFARKLHTGTFFEQLPIDGNLSTLFLSLVNDTEAIREFLAHLLTPRYDSIRGEILAGLLPHVQIAQLQSLPLEKLLSEEVLIPPLIYQKLLKEAFKRDLSVLNQRLSSFLQKLGAVHISDETIQLVRDFLNTHPSVPLSLLDELLDLHIVSPEMLWERAVLGSHSTQELLDFSRRCTLAAGVKIASIEKYWEQIAPSQTLDFLGQLLEGNFLSAELLFQAAITNKKNLKNLPLLCQFSYLCLRKAGSPIPSLESFWIEQPRTFTWPLLESIYAFPHSTENFRREVIQTMEHFLEKSGQYISLLDPKMKIPAPLVAKVVELAMPTRQGKALELLCARPDAAQQMSLKKLWKILVAAAPLFSSKKSSAQESLKQMMRIGIERLQMKQEAGETIEILLTIPASVYENFYAPLFDLFYANLEKIKEEPIKKFWTYFKLILKNEHFPPEKIKHVAARTLLYKINTLDDPHQALFYLNQFLRNYSNDEVAVQLALEVFDNIWKKMGDALYLQEEAYQIWAFMAEKAPQWQLHPEELALALTKLEDHFFLFSKQRTGISSELFFQIAHKLSSTQKTPEVLHYIEYLQVLNSLPSSKIPLQNETQDLCWKQAWLKMRKLPWKLEHIPQLIDLHRNAKLSAPDKVADFLSLQHIILKQIEDLATAHIKAKTTEEEKSIFQYIEKIHSYYMSFYHWLDTKPDLAIDRMHIYEALMMDGSVNKTPLPIARVRYFTALFHLHVLAAARMIHHKGTGRYMQMVGDILKLGTEDPFVLLSGELHPFLQLCFDVCSKVEDLIELSKFAEPFIQKCTEVPEKERSVAMALLFRWLYTNLERSGFTEAAGRIAIYGLELLRRKDQSSDSKEKG